MAAKKNGNGPPARCVTVAPAAIRDDLEEGNCAEAVYTAYAALLSELAWVRRHRSATDAMLVQAEVAGHLTGVAACLRQQVPQRPGGYTGGIPQGKDLRAVFNAALNVILRRAAEGASHG